MKLKCPRCGNFVETGTATFGQTVTCTCGNVLSVPKKSGMPWWVILLILGGACIPCTGVLAAISIPNFIKFQSRAKQAECRAQLRSLYSSAKYSAADQGLTTDLEKIGFSPERGNRYGYFTSFDGPIRERATPGGAEAGKYTGVLPDSHRYPKANLTVERAQAIAASAGVEPGVTGECPDCQLTAICIGNIDGDEAHDVWSVSTADRTSPSGAPVAAGEVSHDLDDVKN